jgi:hypothetical protein
MASFPQSQRIVKPATRNSTVVRTRKPANRTARVQRLGNLLVLWITEGKKIDAYKMTPIPADFGVGIELQKADQGHGTNEAYQVNVNGRDSLCCCKGFEHHGHCRHVESLTALIAGGQLADALPEPPEPEEGETVENAEAPAEPGSVCFECGRPSHDFYCDQCGNI